jgi:NMD protein affecting ribosome stability and mRNA decay
MDLELAMQSYCHNCGHFSQLNTSALCTWCVRRFYELSRLPRPTDNDVPVTALAWSHMPTMEVSP